MSERSLIDDLGELDEQVRAAARAYLDGDLKQAIEILEDARILLADVLADARRDLEAAE